MPHYLIQFSYQPDKVKAMMDNPQDRSESARKVVEVLGGKIESFYFSFGDADVVVICELPDNQSAAACAMLDLGVGLVSSYKTTVLLTPGEAVEAMKKAGTLLGSYQPPTG